MTVILSALRAGLSYILAAAMIAAALAYLLRWDVSAGPMGSSYVVRLDRWTGKVVRCIPFSVSVQYDHKPGDVFECER